MEQILGDKNHKKGLWAIFRLDQSRYCFCGETLAAIVLPEKLASLPEMPDYFAGLLKYNHSLIPVIDMRILFGIPSMEECIKEFAKMKQRHEEWVEDLKKSVETGTMFQKPVDPHKCSFGIWYDSFTTKDYSLNYVLKKIEKPHERIHSCGVQVYKLLEQGKSANVPLEEADRICRQEMIPLLDSLIEAYRDANRGIIFVINWEGNRVGMFVDEALGLVEKIKTAYYELSYHNHYIASAVEDKNGILLCINIGSLPFLQEIMAPKKVLKLNEGTF